MRSFEFCLVALVLMTFEGALTPRTFGAGPATRPALEERAERELTEQTAKLDAEYRAHKAALLRKYIVQLSAAKTAAIQKRDRETAQRLYDAIVDAQAKVAELAPAPAVEPAKAIKFNVQIDDFDGAAGFSKVVEVTPTNVTITAKNDFGRPPKVVWQAALTVDQRDRFAGFMQGFPLDKLADSYVDPSVFDGFQVTFVIQWGKGQPRKIFVGNRSQRDLQKLMEEVNELIPPKFMLSRMGT